MQKKIQARHVSDVSAWLGQRRQRDSMLEHAPPIKHHKTTKPPWYQWYLVASARVEQPQRCSASWALQWRSSSPAWTSWPGSSNNKTNATTAACNVMKFLYLTNLPVATHWWPTLARWARNLPLMMTSTPLAPFSMMNLDRQIWMYKQFQLDWSSRIADLGSNGKGQQMRRDITRCPKSVTS